MANNKQRVHGEYSMTLKDAVEGKEYIIQQIETDDEELNAFCFLLDVMVAKHYDRRTS